MIGSDASRSWNAAEVSRLLELGLDWQAARLGAAEGDSAPGATLGGRMGPVEQLNELGPVLAGVVGKISPDQLTNPTPCTKFTVRDVLEHMVGGATAFAAAFRGQPPPAPAPSTDVLAAFGPALQDLAAAISQPGALQRTVAAPFGDVDAEACARFVVLDGLVHAWDLAQATGQSISPSHALVTDVTAFAHGALDGLRDGDTFGPALAPPADATAMERLAAFTGRQVR
jgi:uncharacterized protein (TIGR03086 family)